MWASLAAPWPSARVSTSGPQRPTARTDLSPRRCGQGAFTWRVVAGGEEQAIKLLEAALIAAWGTSRLGGLNAVGGLPEPPVRDLDYDRFAEEMDRDVRLPHMFTDLEAVIGYVEKHGPTLRGDSLDALRGSATRLLEAVPRADD